MFNLESSLYPNYLFPDYKLENEVHDSNKLSSNNQNSINSIISNIPDSYYSSIPIKEIQSIEINTQKENNSSKPIEEIQSLEKNSNSFNSSMLFEMGQFSENPSESFSSSIPLGIIQTIKVNNPQKEKSTNNNNDSSSNKKKITIRTKKKKHDKFSRDNIKRKIQVHYIKFLRALLNHIIKEILKENIEFKPLDYKFVMKIDKKSFLSIKEKSLGAIFKEHPSPKFKEYKQMNIEVYNKIINKSKKLKNILDKLYLEFINIYYYNIKKIDGRKYGFDKDIDLSNNINIKFYKDLIETNETNSSSDNELYNNKIKNIMQMEFVSKISPVFVCK
jgi:hypothetical protein